MLSRFKSVLMSAVGASELGLPYSVETKSEEVVDTLNYDVIQDVENMPYSRPSFLGLTAEETQVSADHRVRPIIVPRDLSRLPWCAGYAECINAGKSLWNEDQAAATRGSLDLPDLNISLPYIMFSMFDGHASYQVALTSRLYLHRVILDKLLAIPGEALLSEAEGNYVKIKDLVVGAIELAYRQMDQMVEIQAQNGGGGCTAITILFLNGRFYSAGAGDSRSVLVLGDNECALTRDHTPDSESDRVRALGHLKGNELLKGQLTFLQFKKRPIEKDLGNLVLYREPFMTGWAYKKLTSNDINKLPLVSGRGKRSRVLGTIGVTRGFGDHGLKAANTGVSIKPFLSSQPEVACFNFDNYNITERDCIIMATDGLWDVVSEKEAAVRLRKILSPDEPSLECRLTMAAQDLVQSARGRSFGRAWLIKPSKTNDSSSNDEESSGEMSEDELRQRKNYTKMASVDDISVLVIPLYPYLCEHKQWLKTTQEERLRLNNSSNNVTNNAT